MTNHMFDSRKTYVSSPVVTILVSNRILFQGKKKKTNPNKKPQNKLKKQQQNHRKKRKKKAKLTQLLSLRWLSKIFSFKTLCTQHDSQP